MAFKFGTFDALFLLFDFVVQVENVFERNRHRGSCVPPALGLPRYVVYHRVDVAVGRLTVDIRRAVAVRAVEFEPFATCDVCFSTRSLRLFDRFQRIGLRREVATVFEQQFERRQFERRKHVYGLHDRVRTVAGYIGRILWPKQALSGHLPRT